MENAEPLSFVKPFEPLTEHYLDEERKESSAQLFSMVCQSLLAKHKHNIETIESPSPIGTVTTFEVSLIVPSANKSPVYALIFGQQSSKGVLNMGICVEEYDEAQGLMRGYTYGLDGEGFARTANLTENQGIQDTPFSMIALLRDMTTLDLMEASDNPEDQEEARMQNERLNEDSIISAYEADMGYDGQTPDEDEVYQLADLLLNAKPRIEE